jgi:copper chaperone
MKIGIVLAGSLAVLPLLGAAGIPCCGRSDAAAVTAVPRSQEQEKLETVRLEVPGMFCGGCAVATRAALRKLAGVEKVEVSLEERSAVVTYDPSRVNRAQMLEAIRRIGFDAEVAG